MVQYRPFSELFIKARNPFQDPQRTAKGPLKAPKPVKRSIFDSSRVKIGTLDEYSRTFIERIFAAQGSLHSFIVNNEHVPKIMGHTFDINFSIPCPGRPYSFTLLKIRIFGNWGCLRKSSKLTKQKKSLSLCELTCVSPGSTLISDKIQLSTSISLGTISFFFSCFDADGLRGWSREFGNFDSKRGKRSISSKLGFFDFYKVLEGFCLSQTRLKVYDRQCQNMPDFSSGLSLPFARLSTRGALLRF